MSDASSCPRGLQAGNDVFHEAYEATRDSARHEVPILVVMPSELALHYREERQGFPYSRPSFDRAKSGAHIAVALFALTCSEAPATRTREQLARLLEHTQAAQRELGDSPDSQPLNGEIRSLLGTCQRFAEAALERATAESERSEFARRAGPSVLRITELATREQIAGLHEAVDRALDRLSSEDQQRLQVVVVGDHQARTRSLGMQYFQRRFREQPGTDERVTYGENIADEEEAIALVGTRRLDRLIARAFFGDEKRLQRDVLGDAAKLCIEQMQWGDER
jgi:hypothetical protein